MAVKHGKNAVYAQHELHPATPGHGLESWTSRCRRRAPCAPTNPLRAFVPPRECWWPVNWRSMSPVAVQLVIVMTGGYVHQRRTRSLQERLYLLGPTARNELYAWCNGEHGCSSASCCHFRLITTSAVSPDRVSLLNVSTCHQPTSKPTSLVHWPGSSHYSVSLRDRARNRTREEERSGGKALLVLEVVSNAPLVTLLRLVYQSLRSLLHKRDVLVGAGVQGRSVVPRGDNVN